MPTRDLGVSPDYVDRAFRKLDAEAATRDDPKGLLALQFRRKRVQCGDLAAIQAARPLSRPGSGASFRIASPVFELALLERDAEEKRRQEQ